MFFSCAFHVLIMLFSSSSTTHLCSNHYSHTCHISLHFPYHFIGSNFLFYDLAPPSEPDEMVMQSEGGEEGDKPIY